MFFEMKELVKGTVLCCYTCSGEDSAPVQCGREDSAPVHCSGEDSALVHCGGGTVLTVLHCKRSVKVDTPMFFEMMELVKALCSAATHVVERTVLHCKRSEKVDTPTFFEMKELVKRSRALISTLCAAE